MNNLETTGTTIHTAKKLGMVVVLLAMIMTSMMFTACGKGDYPDEVVFDKIPVWKFLDMTMEDIIAKYGEPDDIDETRINYINYHYTCECKVLTPVR